MRTALRSMRFARSDPGSITWARGTRCANYETAFYDFELADNNSYEQWSQEGAHDQLRRAHVRWRAQLAAYEAPPLDVALDEALCDYITRAKRRCRMSSPEA